MEKSKCVFKLREVTLQYTPSLQEFLPHLYNIYRVESIHLGINEVRFTVRNAYSDRLGNDIINMVIILTLDPYQKRVSTFRGRIPGYVNDESSTDTVGVKLMGRVVPADSEENVNSDNMKEYIPILPMYMAVDTDCLKIEIHYHYATKDLMTIDTDPNSRSQNRFALQDLHLYRSSKDKENDNLYTILYRDEYGQSLLFPNKFCDPDKSVYMPIYKYDNPYIQGLLTETYEYSLYVEMIQSPPYIISNRPVYDKDTIETMYDKICKEIQNKSDILDFLGNNTIPVIARVHRTAINTEPRDNLILATYLLEYLYQE